LVSCWLVMAASAAHARTSQEITYQLLPVIKGGNLTALTVEMRFQANSSGRTELELPDHYAEAHDLYRHIAGLQIEGARSIDTRKPQTRIIFSAPFAPIIVRYRLDPNLKLGEVMPAAAVNDPAIWPDQFHVFGVALFARVADRDNAPVKVHWAVPRGWTFASDLEYLKPGATQTQVQRSILVGGTHLDVRQVPNHGATLRVVRGKRFNAGDGDIDAYLLKIVQTEQAFWADQPQPYLVTLWPMQDATSVYYRGSGTTGAFAIDTTPGVSEDELSLLLAHEYFHHWNPPALGDNEGGHFSAWFAEGFTDYYARKLALKAGVIGLKTFVSAWNTALNRYASSPDRTLSNTALAAAFNSDYDLERQTYDRGSILAAYLDAEWRAKGVTLDQFMRTFRDMIVADPELKTKTMIARVEAVAERLHVPVDDELDRFVTQGDPIILPTDTFGPCLTVRTETVPIFDLGYDADRTASVGVFAGVDPKGPAYAAGIRDGMKRTALLAGEPGNSTVTVRFTVIDSDGHEREISYLPKGRGQFDRQQIVLPQGTPVGGSPECPPLVSAN